MNEAPCRNEPTVPAFSDLAADLTRIAEPRLIFSLSFPFFLIALYFLFATLRWWPIAVGCLVCLSFVTYGSISHDLVHGNLGLRRRTNDFLLSLIELLALRSGHAYRLAHLHHHARYPHHDDIEGAAADMSLPRTLLEGVIFQPRIWWWAVRRSNHERSLILLEGLGCLTLAATAAILYPLTPIFLVYAVLMIMGSWVIPLATSYIPHDTHGTGVLSQTRRFRGIVASTIAVEHLYHLEHHLYPAVPHHHWPALARRLDPFLDQAGVKPIKLWF